MLRPSFNILFRFLITLKNQTLIETYGKTIDNCLLFLFTTLS